VTDTDRTLDLIDRTAERIRADRLDEAAVAAATSRVWAALTERQAGEPPLRSCADVRALLPALVAGELPETRALLVSDHTRECLPCRRALLELRGDRAASSPAGAVLRPARTLPSWLRVAAAALVVVAGGVVAATIGGNLAADRRLTASVASADGTLQLVDDQRLTDLAPGDTVRAGQRVRTGRAAGAFVRLADGSMVEMAPRSELELHGSMSGTTVELGRGRIIVHAADQGRDRLRVTTADCEVAVKGTIFAVNHGLKGSRVAVIEGEVEVRQGASQAVLLPGDQLTTDERLREVAIEEAFAWSANAEEHRELLAELGRLHRDVVAAVDIGEPRTSTRLLELAPPDTVVYVAMPNLTDGLGAARRVFSSRLADSEALREWWQREIVDRGVDAEIEASLDRLQFLGATLGDEVVVALDATALDGMGGPVVLAALDDPRRFRSALEEHLAGFPAGEAPVAVLSDLEAEPPAGTEVVIWVGDDLVAAGPSLAAVRGVAGRLADPSAPGFAGSELHARLAERYADGVEWLIGVDIARTTAASGDAASPEERAMMERFGLLDATTLVVERHRSDAGSAIDADLRFAGPRRGIAAWLAAPAPLAALDYVSADASLAAAVAAKDGAALFDELLGMVAEVGPDALSELTDIESEIGIDLRDDLAVAIGGEGAFALDGPVLPMPAWKLIVEVYDPALVEHSVERVLERANAELAANGGAPIAIVRDTVGGRRFTSVSHPSSPMGFTYTVTDGFLVAGASRAVVEQAIRVRSSGLGLARSAVFRELLPDNGFADCSAVLYSNFGPILEALPAGAAGGELGGYGELLAAGAAPALACAYGLEDRILVAGSGPSPAALAPLLGLGGLQALAEGSTAGTVDHGPDGVSSGS
jgi:ferric-dicitrate binding protein FerR (iron transport regulator)